MDDGKYDERNQLNDLTGKQWLKLTKSFWVSEKCVLDKDAFAHPAPYLVRDTMKLISLFTKKGMMVLDPFCGSGTTLIAAAELGRNSIGVDLSEKYRSLALQRLEKLGYNESDDYHFLVGNSLDVVPTLPEVDYIVTSPPYHNILKNKGDGLRKKKENQYRNGARIGVEFYSDDDDDIGNKESFDDFIQAFHDIMEVCYGRLKTRRYCTIVVSDFTVDKKEKSVQSEIITSMETIGFEFSGTTVLLQDTKPLYPFGYPYAYKINHQHQNLITFRKI